MEAEDPVHRPTVHRSVFPLSGSNGDGVLPWTRPTPAFAAPKTTEAVRSSLGKIEQEQVVKQMLDGIQFPRTGLKEDKARFVNYRPIQTI